MKKLKLSHEKTPADLVVINTELETLLANEGFDDAQLLKLVDQRDELIQNYLSSLDDKAKQSFATAELEVNKNLTKVVQKFFKSSLSQLSRLMRGRKAVEKYK